MKTKSLYTAVFALTALAGMNAFAANQTSTTIGLTATVSSFDNITCSQQTLDLNGSTGITKSGLTAGQQVSCSVTTNDTTPVDVTAYVSSTSPLTGTTNSNTIPNTAIEWGTSSSGSFTPFAALTGDLAGNDGAIVASSVAVGDNEPISFYLALNVPAGQHADTYSATLVVAITPAVV